jgi:ribose transport system substrate-binding protein
MKIFGRNCALLACLVLAAMAGCDSGGGQPNGDHAGSDTAPNGKALRRLIFMTNGDDPFWDAMRAGIDDANRDFKLAEKGLRAELDKNDGTAKGQIDKLKQYAGQSNIAGVGISVIDSQNVSVFEALRALGSQGVKVITVDSDVDRERGGDARFAYLGTDNIVGGNVLGIAGKGLKPEGCKYAAFVGIKSTANAQERSQGFADAAGEKFERVDYLADDMDPSTAQKNVRDVLDRHPDLGMLVGIWAYNAHAIAQTVKDRGIREQVAIVNFDAAPKAITHMEAGLIDALVVQNPYEMGYQGTKLLAALVQDDHDTIGQIIPAYEQDEHSITKPGGDIILTGLKVVVPDDDKRLNAEMFEGQAEFLTLSEFKAWLKKYKLTGS